MNILFKIGKFPFSANGKALAAGEPEGFVKIIIGERDPHAKGNLSTVNSSVLVDERANERRRKLVDWSVKLG